MDSVVMSMLGYSNSSTPVVVTPKKSIRSTAKGISSISASRSNVCEECGAVPKQEIGVATMDKSNKAIDRLTLNNKPNYETGDRCIKKVVNPLRTCTMANELLPPPPIRPPRPVSLDLDLLKQEVPSVVVLQRKVTRQHSPGSPGIKLQSGSKLSTRRSTNLRDSNRGEGSIEQKHVQKVSIFKAMSQSVIQMGSQAKRIFMGNSRLSALQIGTLPPLPVTSSLNPDTDIPKSHRSNSEFWSPSIIPIVSLRESAAAAAAAVEATENHTFDSRIGTRDIGLPTFVPIHVPVRSESRLKRSRQFSTANAPINK
ncbi:hypothetical protein BGZ76_000318 [Entomortierella beljakovae]|nr:hypothetical protein BGZ76_000318 [Entomortierella beljakovae]